MRRKVKKCKLDRRMGKSSGPCTPREKRKRKEKEVFRSAKQVARRVECGNLSAKECNRERRRRCESRLAGRLNRDDLAAVCKDAQWLANCRVKRAKKAAKMGWADPRKYAAKACKKRFRSRKRKLRRRRRP